MVESYEVIKQGNIDVLYLYFDLSNEFARKNFNKQKSNLEKVVQKFIKNNKIAFAGSIVAIVINGLFVGNIILNKPVDNRFSDSSVLALNIEANNNSNLEKKDLDEDLKIEEQINEDKNDSNKDIINSNPLLNKIDSVKPINEESSEINQKVENIESSKTYVTIKRKSGEIQKIELEQYLIGVVAAEMPAEFNKEALKAQSVIARTYTLKALAKGQILSDNESTQSYKDNEELQMLWQNNYSKYINKISNAVKQTENIILTYDGKLIEAVYHSTSNGQTEDAINVWGNAFPYLVSVDSPYDIENKSFEFSKSLSYEEITNKLKREISNETNITILSKTVGNRVQEIMIEDQIFTGVNLRNILGLRSADFEISKNEEGLIFTTRGYGHGVGMSQYGANGMAKEGYNYMQILLHYYPGVTIDYK